MAEPHDIAWQSWLAGWLHAKGMTLKDLGVGFTGYGGENALKEAFHEWTRSQEALLLNEWERAYIIEICETLAKPNDLTESERYLLENEVAFIQQGSIGFTGPQTVEERLWRLRNHYP